MKTIKIILYSKISSIKNEIAADNPIKLIETSLTEIGVETTTQTETGGVTLRELQCLDKEFAKQVDIDKAKKKLDEMASDEAYSDEHKKRSVR